jgi:hypothetical protein
MAICTSDIVAPERLVAPHVGDIVSVTLESHICKVRRGYDHCLTCKARLKDSLVSSLQFSKIQDQELAWIDGELVAEDADKDIPVIDAVKVKVTWGALQSTHSFRDMSDTTQFLWGICGFRTLSRRLRKRALM